MTVRFLKFKVTDGKNSARVSYSFDPNPNNKSPIRIYAKDYGNQLSKIFKDVRNDTDIMTDYFDKDKLILNDGDKYYKEAREAAIKHWYPTLKEESKVDTKIEPKNVISDETLEEMSETEIVLLRDYLLVMRKFNVSEIKDIHSMVLSTRSVIDEVNKV